LFIYIEKQLKHSRIEIAIKITVSINQWGRNFLLRIYL